jgi:hypothetical protein
LTCSEEKANILGDAKFEQSQTADRTRGTLRYTNAFRKVPPVCRRPEFVHPECTNIELSLWSGRGLCDDEDSGISWEVSWGVPGPNLCSMDAQTTWDCFVA